MHYYAAMPDTLPPDPGLLREVGETCLCLQVQRASRAVGRHYDEAFRPLDLTNWQFSLLTALGATELPSVNELAAVLGADRTTMTRNLHVLERRGLVAMQADDADGRIRRARLTPAGSDLLARALPRWRVVNEAMKAQLSAAALPGLTLALERLARP